MKKLSLLICAVLLSANAMAFKTVVKSKVVGDVAISSKDSEWKVDAKIISNGEKEVITIELNAPKAMTPPHFNVEFLTPQLDAHHLWEAGNSDKAWLQPDWRGKYDSSLARSLPLYSFINTNNRNRLTIASSEAIRKVEARMGFREEGALLHGVLRFFVEPDAPLAHYKVTIVLDNRDIFWADAVREGVKWIESQNDFKVCRVPDSAFDPLYSSWYQFHQQITDKEIEAECREASKLGMKTIIVDDGWQNRDIVRDYATCGDWQPAPNRFADMRIILIFLPIIAFIKRGYNDEKIIRKIL